MTSEKYFIKWIKEAGRGHLAAFLSWVSLAVYAVIAVVQLGMSTEYHFFGIGSSEFLRLCEGLGFALSFLEFIYLLQPKKLDFYYGLPVRKSTIFWSRYAHGLLHFLIPLVFIMTALGLFESSIDLDFMSFSASYTGRSILTFAAVFLIFYHIGILLITICGNVLPAILGCVVVLFYGNILIGSAITALAKNYFHTYYRIPLFEKMDVILAPLSLSENLAGDGMYSKTAVFQYIPSALNIAATLVWIVFLSFVFTAAQKKRKTERVGRIFVVLLAERAAEVLLSFAAGVWSGSLFIDLSGLAEESPAAAFAFSMMIGMASASAVHFLLEWGVGGLAAGGIFRRKRQLIVECAAVIFTGMVFFTGASSFDHFWPEEGEIEKIGISIDGLDMGYDVYRPILEGVSRYETDEQLETYLFAEDGKDAAVRWLFSLIEKNSSKGMGEGGSSDAEMLSDESAGNQKGDYGVSSDYTHAVVCYHMKNGKEIYRIYPVSEEELQAYDSVYETDEYKRTAYQVPDSRYVMDARFLWSDGVTDTVLKLEDDEKEELLDVWQSDVDCMKMENLMETLPLGLIEIDSEMRMVSTEMVVYPFFSQTCEFLEKHGIQIFKTVSDYPVSSVSVGSVLVNGMGNQSRKYYQEPEEIEHWKEKVIPERLDLQPLLCPLDYSQEIRVEAEDETTNSVVYVYCYSRAE